MQSIEAYQKSVFSHRIRIYKYVTSGEISGKVLNELLPNGEPLFYERHLWDYKLELPILSVDRKPTEHEKKLYNLKMLDIVKDVVSFYNSYGGYLVIGVRDNPRTIEGFSKQFNCDELNRKISGITRHDVDCYFQLLDYTLGGQPKKIGMLFIPQRPDSKDPAQFLRNADASDEGKIAFKKNDIYFRQGDQCICATNSEEYSFLCSQGRRKFVLYNEFHISSCLENNLGARDPDFIRFIGREKYISELWRWLWDKYSPVKLLTGLGGVGKTTIAREFTEEITKNPPAGFEKVVWLSAKQLFFTAIRGTYVKTSRVDFYDTNSLLKTLLAELGTPEDKIDDEWARDELVEQIINSLLHLPSFIVIDDLDTLSSDDQHEVFHTLIQIISQTISASIRSSRCLMTARLDLGASLGQLIRITGLEFEDFVEYVAMTAKNFGLVWNHGKSKLKRFYEVTDGSPIFGSSILKLLQFGEPLDTVLNNWRGKDGEEVRKFTFEKELNQLNDFQIRTLYAACILGDTSLVELQHITESNNVLLRDGIG
jgi:hypothetical protein